MTKTALKIAIFCLMSCINEDSYLPEKYQDEFKRIFRDLDASDIDYEKALDELLDELYEVQS